jgi:hypothetical protein
MAHKDDSHASKDGSDKQLVDNKDPLKILNTPSGNRSLSPSFGSQNICSDGLITKEVLKVATEAHGKMTAISRPPPVPTTVVTKILYFTNESYHCDGTVVLPFHSADPLEYAITRFNRDYRGRRAARELRRSGAADHCGTVFY